MNFCNFMKKTGRNTELFQKKLSFGQTYLKFDGCHGNIKNDGHAIDKSKFLQRMKEQLLKILALKVNRLFKIWKNLTFIEVTWVFLVRPRVKVHRTYLVGVLLQIREF